MKKQLNVFLSLAVLCLLITSDSLASDGEFLTKLESNNKSNYSVNYLTDVGNISIFDFSGNYDRSINGQPNSAARQALTQEFYRHHSDDYDFLVIFTQFPVDSGESAAFAISYVNDVEGIGIPLFDISSQMGSERLQTTIDMTELGDWNFDARSRMYELTLGVLMHEMMHRWGVFVQFLDSNDELNGALIGESDAHWSYFVQSNASVMYGSLWEELSAGVFETTSTRKSLSPLDLYLMGLNEPSAVPDFFVIDNGSPGNRTDLPPQVGTQAIGSRINVSVNDIIAAEGPRIPAASEAQKQFAFKFVLLKNPGQVYNEDDIGKLIVLQREFQKRFFAETGGRGEIIYDAVENIGINGSPEGLNFNQTNRGEADLNDAREFLDSADATLLGYWADKEPSKVRDTAMAVKAFQSFEESELAAIGATWLNQYNAINNDELAWQLLSGVLTNAKKQQVVSDLLGHINEDGGWGLSFGSESSMFDTSLILKALLSDDSITYTPSSNTILFVADFINSDFGIGYSTGGVTSLSSSAMLLSVFEDITSDNEGEQLLVDYLISKQHPDGGFGVDGSTVHETALLLDALSSVSAQNTSESIALAIAKLHQMQSIDGSFEGSYYSTALASIVLLDDNRPNIKLLQANISNNDPIAGEVVVVEFSILLQGEEGLNNIDVGLYLGDNLIEMLPVSHLDPSQIFTANFTLDTNTYSGSYDLTLKIDAADEVVETNELDNEHYFNLRVTEQSNTPELVIVNNSVTYQPNQIDILPVNFELQFDVVNLSSTSVEDVQITLYQKIDSGLKNWLSEQRIDVFSNQNINVQFTQEITESFNQSLEFIIELDDDNEINEVNETNNSYVISINKDSVLDVAVSSADIQVPSSTYVGIPVMINYVVQNTGTVTSPTLEISLINIGQSNDELAVTTVSPLAPGERRSLNFEQVFEQTGNHQLQIFVDRNNSINEINEANNVAGFEVMVQENNLSNLSLTDAEIQFSIEPGLEGGAVNVFVPVHNTSTVDTPTFDLSLLVQKGNEDPQVIATLKGLNGIGGGSSRVEEFMITEIDFSGAVFIIASVDSDQLVDEFDETDNTAFAEFTVLSKADAVVSSGGVSLTPTTPVVGESLSVDVTLNNSGEQNIDSIGLNLYLVNSTDQTSTLISSDHVSLLAPGNSSIISFDFIFPNDPGIDQLQIIVDEEQELDEGNETNNKAIIIIGQQDNSFYNTNPFFSPNGDGIKDTVQVIFNLDEVDNYRITIRNSLNQIVKEFGYDIFSQTSFGDVVWDGRGIDGSLSPDGEYFVKINGQNTHFEKELSIWLDTNRHTLAETLKNDTGVLFDLNCQINNFNSNKIFSADGKYLYVYSYRDKANLLRNGVFRIKADGSEIKSLLPEAFTSTRTVTNLWINIDGQLIIEIRTDLNDDELWKLHPQHLSLSQLSTDGIDDFRFQDLSNGQLTINHFNNSDLIFSRISLDPQTPPQTLNFSPAPNSSNRLKRVFQGWIWEVTTDGETYDLYFKNDNDTSGTQLITSGNYSYHLSLDKKSILLKNQGSLELVKVNNGTINIIPLASSQGYFQTFASRFSPINEALTVSDKIRIHDDLGYEVISVSHRYNYEYFVEQIIAEYGSTEGLIYDESEAGEVIYNLSDLQNLRIDIENLRSAWGGEKELYLSFSAILVGEIELGENWYETLSFYDNNSEQIKLRINYSDLNDIEIIELNETDVSNSKFIESVSNYFNMGVNVLGKNLDLEPPEYYSHFADDYLFETYFPDRNTADVVKALYVTGYAQGQQNTCTSTNDTKRAVYVSKQNLTTFLSAEFKNGTVEIAGSAFDQFLSNYTIEWRRNDLSAANWNYIQSGGNDQIKDLFGYWTPPAPGAYTIRLRAEDKSGNILSDEVEILVGDDINGVIESLQVSPKYISPNYDGVQDEVNIQYDLSQPVDVLVEITSEAGTPVKTIVRDYSVGLTADQFTWDGTDDLGNTVADGQYLISLEGMDFRVIVDTEEPNIELDVKQQFTTSGYYDLYLKKNIIIGESQDGSEETDALEAYFERYDTTSDEWRIVNQKIHVNPYNYEAFKNLRLRARAIDYAGNTGVSSEVYIDTDQSVAVDIRRKKQVDDEFEVGVAPLRNLKGNLQPVTIDKINYPIISNPDFNEHLGLTIQAKTFQPIQSVEMRMTYLEEIDGELIETENLVSLALADISAAQSYFPYHDLVTVQGSSKLFQMSHGEGEIYLNFLEIDQSDFPDTDRIISVELIIAYSNAVIHQDFNIEFAKKTAFVSFFKTAPGKPLFKSSVMAPLAYDHMELKMFEESERRDIWFYSEIHSEANSPTVTVINNNTSEIVEVLVPHYEEDSNQYISQYFRPSVDSVSCDEILAHTLIYNAIDENDEPIRYEIVDRCCDGNTYFKSWYDTAAFCENNADIDTTLKVYKSLNIPPELRNTQPHSLSVTLMDSEGREYAFHADDFPTINDSFAHEFTKEIDKLLYPDGGYLMTSILNFDVIFQSSDGSEIIEPVEIFYRVYINIEKDVALSQISSPSEGQKICAVDSPEMRKIPFNFVSTLSTDSPYSQRFHHQIDGSIRPIFNTDPKTQFSLAYEEENNFNTLIENDRNVFSEFEIGVGPETESVSIIHEVVNSTGVSYCSEVEIEIDAKLDAQMDILEDDWKLSPDGDGVNDMFNFGEIIANEQINVIVELFDHQSENKVGLISSYLMVPEQTLSLSWDGYFYNEIQADDGAYYIQVSLQDTCGLSETVRVNVLVDTRPPVVSFVSPINGEVIGSPTEMFGTIEEANFDHASIEFYYNNVWNFIPSESLSTSNPSSHEIEGIWNSFGMPQGDYTLRLKAVDLLGNEAESTIDVSLPFEQDIFWNYVAEPKFLSPNNDGIQDSVSLTLGLNVDADLNIDVIDNSTSSIQSLVTNGMLNTGTHSFIWNGLNNGGNVVTDGNYQIRTQASEVAQPTNSETVHVSVILDTTAPSLSYSVLDQAVIKGEGLVALTITEDHIEALSVHQQAVNPISTQTELINEPFTGTLDVVSLSELEEKEYQLTSNATDKAGNAATKVIHFEIDNTPPVIDFETPMEGEFVGSGGDNILFSAEIEEKNFVNYQLFISPESDVPQWQLIHTGVDLIDGRFDFSWPISVEDGSYLLRVASADQAGWESEIIRLISIDREVPEAMISEPLQQSLHGPSITISGTADDENFSHYLLSYQSIQEPNEGTWELIHTAVEPVTNGQFFVWNHDLSSADYRLRLMVVDKSGFESESVVELSVDTEAPETPLFLELELAGPQDIRLNWGASASNDVIGYYIYKNNTQLNHTPIQTTDYLDSGLLEGEYTYWVLAVDGIGNISSPTNLQKMIIDTTGPEVLIHAPGDGAVVNDVIKVNGTAHSVDDFSHQIIYLREINEGSPGIMIWQSSLSTISQDLTQIETSTLVDGATYVVRLEGYDLSGNMNLDEHQFVVDNTPPAAPLNLAYQLIGGNDVTLNWNANSEADLAGYLVYKNGVIISGNGTVESSIISEITYDDLDVVDGQHVYHVVAVDAAGNISSGSNSVQVDIDLRPPHAVFVAPNDGDEFGALIRLEAFTEDSDVASVQFDYSTDGTVWTVLATDPIAPYDFLFDPIDAGLVFGDVHFRVTATDQASQVDPAPDQITLEYKDLTPPSAITSLNGLVVGDQIQLNWDVNTESDLAGYEVYRKRITPDPEDNFNRLTLTPESNNQYIDLSLNEGTYIYQVSAVDNNDNQSVWVESSDLTVFSVTLSQPYSPLVMPNTTDVEGLTKDLGVVNATLYNAAGSTDIGAAQHNGAGRFFYENISLEIGDNQFTAVEQTTEGHTSIDSVVSVQLSPIPTPPINPVVNSNGFDVSLTWESPNPETKGYLPYINQTPVYPIEQRTDYWYTAASSNDSQKYYFFDQNLNTGWAPSWADRTNGIPVFAQVELYDDVWVTEVKLHWDEKYNSPGEYYVPARYMLQYGSPVGWITQEDFTGDSSGVVSFRSDKPYMTQSIRIWMPLGENEWDTIRLNEIEVFHQPYSTALNYDTTLADGEYNLQISAINEYGFESELTESQTVVIGDVTPPDVVTMSGQLQNANQSDLAWTASTSADVSSYRLYRDDELIYISPDESVLTYLDGDLPNGIYAYYVKVEDMVGNLSESSNTVLIEVEKQLLLPPAGLLITPAESGGALLLNWAEVIDPQFDHYLIYRSISENSGFESISLPHTSTDYHDQGLINGSTYFYYVTAVDQSGNESLPSDIKSGTPYDFLPPIKPVIFNPTVHGVPIITDDLMIDVMGFGEPNTTVDLYQNDSLIASQPIGDEFITSQLNTGDSYAIVRYNKYNSHFAGRQNGTLYIVDTERDTVVEVVEGSLREYFWNNAGDKLIVISGYGDQSKIESFGSDGNLLELLHNGVDVSHAILSHDENKLFYIGEGVNPDNSMLENGLWIYNLNDSTYKKLEINESEGLDRRSMHWLPNGDLVFINLPYGFDYAGKLWHYDALNDDLNLLESDVTYRSAMSVSLDGTHVFYVMDDSENRYIRRHRLSDDEIVTYEQTNTDVDMPVVGDDENQVFVNIDCCDKRIINIMTGDVIEDFGYVGYQQEATWLIDGRIMYFNDETKNLHLINPPGTFEFKNVDLEPGINMFYATGTKTNGVISEASDSINVTLNESTLPDLEIKQNYLHLLPVQVNIGQSVSGSVLIKNNSQVDVEEFSLTIELIDPDLNVQSIASSPIYFNLQAGQSLSKTFSIDGLSTIGGYTVRVIADSAYQILEVNENNNTAVKTFQVIDNSTPAIELVLGTTELIPGENLDGMVRVYNPSQTFDGNLVLRITDSEEYPVGFEETFNISNLMQGSAWEDAFIWSSQDVFAGDYLIEAQLFNTDNQLISETVEPFVINEVGEIALTLTTTTPQITVNESVELLGGVDYRAGNVNQSGELIWQIHDQSQQLIWSDVHDTAVMSPGFNGSYLNTWLPNLPGTYQASLTLETPLFNDTITVPFEVTEVDPQLELTGLIEPLQTAVILGQNWQVSFVIENSGEIDLSSIPVKLSVWDSELNEMLLTDDNLVSLNSGDYIQLLTTFESNLLSLDRYILMLTADLSQYGKSPTFLIDTLTVETTDNTGPTITLLNPVDSGFYKSSLGLRADITDFYSDIESCEIILNENSLVVLPGDQFSGIYQYQLTDLTEGVHHIKVVATDTEGNISDQTVSFNVDNTPPIIDVTGVIDDGVYNHSVQANITFVDENLADVQATLNGVSYVSGDPINTEGIYLLMVSANDLAGNTASSRLQFTLDLTPPEVIVTYPAPGNQTTQNNAIVMGTTEFNANVLLTHGTYTETVFADIDGHFNFTGVPLNLGSNVISLSATDSAGNVGPATELEIIHVNHIKVTGDLLVSDTLPINQDLSVTWQLFNDNDFVITQLPLEINLYQVSNNQLSRTEYQLVDMAASSNLQNTFVFDTLTLNPGEYRVELRVETDQMWQTLADHLITLEDVEGPQITVIEPTVNLLSPSAVTLLVQAIDEHSVIIDVSYQLDGSSNWLPMNQNGLLYSVELDLVHGSHEVIFKAVDAFDNETATDVIHFMVDANAPEINVDNPLDGMITNQPVTIDYDVTDDHQFSVDVLLNLVQISNGQVVSDEGQYELSIVATDEVNNQSSMIRHFIIDTTAPTLLVTQPSIDAQNTTGVIDVIGESEARNTIRIYVNSDEYVLKTDSAGHFISENHSLQLGMNVITVSAEDEAGNVSETITRNVDYIQVGSISGIIWQDNDQDGNLDTDEPSLHQVSINLTDENGVIQQSITDASGYYHFSDLSSGQYIIEVTETELLNEWTHTTNNSPTTLNVAIDQNLEMNFGYYQAFTDIEAELTANNPKGRILILSDPPTAQVNMGQCLGVAGYQLQRNITGDFEETDVFTAKLYDSQGALLQTESATWEDFIYQEHQPIDQQTETDEFNLILHSTANGRFKADVVHSSSASPAVIDQSYRLVLSHQNSNGLTEWSSASLPFTCDVFDTIGSVSNDLMLSNVDLYPQLASDDPNSQPSSPFLSSQQVMLETLLDNEGWSYDITTDANEFETKLSSGDFVAYWLIAENVFLSTQTQQNLMSAVDQGAGLMVTSGHDNLSAQFYSSLGVIIDEYHLDADELELLDSPLSEPKTFDILLQEPVLKASLTNSASGGVFKGTNIVSPDNHAISLLNNGAGKMVFSGLDWLQQATEKVGLNHYTELINSTLSHIHPLGLSFEMGYARAIQFNMQNLGDSVDGYVQVYLPPSLTLAHTEIPVTFNADGFVFDYSLFAGEAATFEFWIKLDEPEATLTFDIYLNEHLGIVDSLDLTITSGEYADLSTALSNCVADLTFSQSTSYQFKVSNTGTLDISDAEVFVELFPGLLTPDWTCEGADGGICSQVNGKGNIDAVGVDLPVGSHVVFELNTEVTIQQASSVFASGHVLMPVGITDVNLEDNTSEDFDTLSQFIFKSPFECLAPGIRPPNYQIKSVMSKGE